MQESDSLRAAPGADRVLVIGPDRAAFDGVRQLLEGDGYRVTGCADGAAARPLLRGGGYHLAIVQLGPAGAAAAGDADALRAEFPDLPVIVAGAGI